MSRTYEKKYVLNPMRGYTIVSIPLRDKIALATAYGILSNRRIGETYIVSGDKVSVRMRKRSYQAFIEILTAIDGEVAEKSLE